MIPNWSRIFLYRPDYRDVEMKQLVLGDIRKPEFLENSSNEIANVNFLYDDIVHVLQNTIDSCIFRHRSSRLCVGTHVYQIQLNNAM